MTANFRRWEVDPFFAAAEEVQDSVDRLESAYRTWDHTRGLIETGSEDSELVSLIDIRRRELTTALGTAKWQLEEFERAVTQATLTDLVYVGEDAPARHKQFIEASYDQITSAERALVDSHGMVALKALPVVNLGGADKDDLAMFLSGTGLFNSITDNDTQINVSEGGYSKEEAPSTSSRSGHSRHILPALSPAKGSNVRGVRNWNSDSIHRTEIQEVMNINTNCLHRADGLGDIKNGLLDIRIEPVKPAISNHPAEEMRMESRFYDEDDRCGGTAVERNGSVSRHPNTWKVGRVVRATKNNISETQRTESVASGWNFLAFLSRKRPTDKLKVSKSGFKRWKDGEGNSQDHVGRPTYFSSNGKMDSVEMGTSNNWPGRNKVINGYTLGITVSGEEKQMNGLGEAAQRHSQHTQRTSSRRPVQIASGIIVALGLVGVYFWFLSSLVPYDNGVVP